MTKEETFNHLFEENPLYDPQERKIYIPDVSEPFVYHGIQIATIALTEQEIINELNKYGVQNGLADWAYAVIPAPGSLVTSKRGRLDFYPFDTMLPDDDYPKFNETEQHRQARLETTRQYLREYVDELESDGIMARLVPEDVALEEMSRRTGIKLIRKQTVQIPIIKTSSNFVISCSDKPSTSEIKKVFYMVIKELRARCASDNNLKEVLSFMVNKKQSAR